MRRSEFLSIPVAGASGLMSYRAFDHFAPRSSVAPWRLDFRAGSSLIRCLHYSLLTNIVQCNIDMDAMRFLHDHVREAVRLRYHQICHGFLYFSLSLLGVAVLLRISAPIANFSRPYIVPLTGPGSAEGNVERE